MRKRYGETVRTEPVGIHREDEMKEMAAPFASFANKTPVLRKHGRTIIAAADSWEAILSMVLWARRVNRLARRHKDEIQAARKAKQHHFPDSLEPSRFPPENRHR